MSRPNARRTRQARPSRAAGRPVAQRTRAALGAWRSEAASSGADRSLASVCIPIFTHPDFHASRFSGTSVFRSRSPFSYALKSHVDHGRISEGMARNKPRRERKAKPSVLLGGCRMGFGPPEWRGGGNGWTRFRPHRNLIFFNWESPSPQTPNDRITVRTKSSSPGEAQQEEPKWSEAQRGGARLGHGRDKLRSSRVGRFWEGRAPARSKISYALDSHSRHAHHACMLIMVVGMSTM